MAELIAKIARKKERLPTIHTTSQNRRFTSLSSPLRSFTRSGNHQIQPLPPARNAVPFRVWTGSMPSGLESGNFSVRGTPMQSTMASQGSTTRVSPNGSIVDLPSNDLYMVQEVTVESEVVDASQSSKFLALPTLSDGRMPPPDSILQVLPDGRLPPPNTTPPPPMDDSVSMGDVEPPVIWDGNPMISTVVQSGQTR